MRSIVLGATGVVGGYIVEQLLQAGQMPFALSRSPPAQDARNVCWFRGDLTDLSALALPDFSTIYCTAHAGSLAAGLPHLVGPSVQRLVLFTSSSVVTKLNSDVAYEREGLQRLAAGEAATIAFCEERGIAWTVLRPTIIYDEGRDANISRLARLIAKFGVLPLAGWGAGLRQPVHAQDLAVGALQAAASRAAWNNTYALPGEIRSATAKWWAGSLTDLGSRDGSFRCRWRFGGWLSSCCSAGSRMRTPPWEPGCRKT